MPLVSVNSPIQVHDYPDEGISFWMADGQRRVRVFVTFVALHHEMTFSVGALDKDYASKIFQPQRVTLEAAASKKYDAKGIEGELNGQPALFVTAMDL